MSATDRDFVARAARVGIMAAAVGAGVVFLLFVLKAALTPLAAAFVIAYLLDPWVVRFQGRRVRRGLAVLLIVGLLGGGLVAFLLLVVPRVQRELAILAERLPTYVDHVTNVILPRIEALIGAGVPRTLEEVLEGARSGELPLPLETMRDFLAGALTTLSGTIGAVVALVFVPILAYYVLVELDTLKARAVASIPPRHRDYVLDKARTVDRLVSGFLRGQLVVAALLGVFYAVGFGVIGIDLALSVGLLAGALSLIPYLGSAVALVLASVLCMLEFGIGGHLVAVIVWYVLVQVLEGLVLTPRIVGQSVGLHPAVVIVALLIGADLFGFLGLLVAVPAAAVVKVFVAEGFEAYRGSALFGEGA